MFRFTSSKMFSRAAILSIKAAALMFCISLYFQPAYAQILEGEKGFYLGIKIIGSSLHIEDDPDDAFSIKDGGGGAQLDIGYRFNRVFSLEIATGGANHDTSDPALSAKFQLFQILAYYRFLPDNPFRPYLKGGIGGYAFLLEEDQVSARINGGGVAFGGGFRYFFSPHFSIGMDLTHNIINYDSAKLAFQGFSYEWAIDEEGSMTSLGLGFAYSF